MVALRFRIALALALAITANAYAGSGEIIRVSGAAKNRYIAVLPPGQSPRAIAAEFRAKHAITTRQEWSSALFGFAFTAPESVARLISADPRVAYVQEDGQSRIAQVVSASGSWGQDRLDQRDLPLDGLYHFFSRGGGVTIYVIDTGVNAVPDLGSRILQSVSFVEGDPSTSDDCVGHGTKVAVIAAGATYGVATAANIVNVRTYDCQGRSFDSWVASAIDWVVSRHASLQDVAVINYSAAGPGPHPAIEQAAQNAVAWGLPFVCAAGDNQFYHASACSYSPASLGSSVGGLMTVANSQSNDWIFDGTNTGPCVEIFAPGEQVTTQDQFGNSVWFFGTSASVPHVSGAMAVFKDALGGMSSYPPAVLEQWVKDNATPGRLYGVPADTVNLLLSLIVDRHRSCCS